MKKAFVGFGILLLLLSPISAFADKEDTKQKIDEYVEQSLVMYNIPGASLAIVKNGEIFYQAQWGVLSDGSAVTADTPFLIGSLSKPITALAVMKLVDEGKIKLEAPIQTYIPSFSYQTDSSKHITVLHLLEQTSGISAYEGLKVTDMDRKEDGAINQAISELSGVKLSNVPGEVYEYNSANYLLLGAIVEKVSNQSFSEYVNTSIFTPLGMEHSAADYERAVEKGYVPGFESWFGKPVKSDGLYDSLGVSYGYITSSANDLLKFLSFMLQGGDLISEKSLELLKTSPPNGKTYGLGWHFSKTDYFPFHGGGTPDFRAEMFYIPEQDLAAVLLTNKYHSIEDAQVTHIMKGIRSIMNGSEPAELPKQSHSIQWILLGVALLFAILTVIHFLFLKSKKTLNTYILFIAGIILFFLAAGLIPLVVAVLGTPWSSVSLFAPDIAFLIYCLSALIALNGVTALFYSWQKKVANLNRNANRAAF